MANTIIITLCILVLAAYIFDLTASKTRIPSVILLLFLGWILRRVTSYFHLHIPDLSIVLPILGTVGLILIVLEGSLELELNKSKSPLISKSFVTALVPMLALAFGMAYIFHISDNNSFRADLLNAIPLCLISSAIAIPSAGGLSRFNREFVIYESSFSDIIGVLLFNFVALNSSYGISTFLQVFMEFLIIMVTSLITTLGLVSLLNRIEHHIKYVPIVLIIILIYSISKIFHLPGLIFVLIFGMFLRNLETLKRIPWIERFNTSGTGEEVNKLKDLVVEGAFLIRTMFFLLFGYLIETKELLNPDTLLWSVGITAGIFVLRAIQLKIFKLPFSPLLFMAPRGLITILLILSIAPEDTIPLVNNSLIIQVIIFTALVMMSGLIRGDSHKEKQAGTHRRNNNYAVKNEEKILSSLSD